MVQSYLPDGTNVHPIKHMLPWTHPSPQPKQHLDRISRFCTAHGLYFTMGCPLCPQNCPFAWGDLDPI